jgi:glycosyltransferase involved in cell wall biosynthesis
LNEEATLAATLADLPREVEGFDTVEWLVIDDGSTDGTADLARQLGVDHLIRFSSNRGLAVAFQAGLDASLKLGADVIVNTDADNQYNADDIPKLVRPILLGEADMVVGTRDVKNQDEFSRTKKVLQSWGSWVVRQASDTEIPDTTSGFRAYSREAALRMNVVTRFTYTLETIIQAGKGDLALTHVPIRTNPKTRDSRLFKSIPQYLKRSIGTIFRIYVMYEPLPVFLWPAAVTGLLGTALFARFGWYYFAEDSGAGHIQSLIVGAVLIIFSVPARGDQRAPALESRSRGAHAPASAQGRARARCPSGRPRRGPNRLRGARARTVGALGARERPASGGHGERPQGRLL